MKKVFVLLLLSFVAVSCFCQVKIMMEKNGNVYCVQGKVNGLPMKFIFDTGASKVSLSLTEAIFMLKNGYIKKADLGEREYAQIANGDIEANTKVILRKIEIGGITINDVEAVISNSLDAPLLLGQSAIQKLGPIQLDGNTLVISNGKNMPSEKMAIKLYKQAYQQVEAGEYAKAIKSSLEAISYTNEADLRAMLYDNLGIAYYNNGDKEKAIESLNLALEENMNYIQARYNLGVFSYEMKLYEQASRAFQLVISSPVSDKTDYVYPAYSYLGLIQSQQGYYKEAEENFLKSIQLCSSSMAYFGLADLYYTKEDFGKAAENYEKGIEFQPDRPSNIKRYFQLGICLIRTKKQKESYDAFNKCVETAYLYRDFINEGVSKHDSIDEQFAKITFEAELWAARTAPNTKEAIKRYNYVMSINRINISINDYLFLCGAYKGLGEEEKAIGVLDIGLKKYIDNPDLLFAKSFEIKDEQQRIELLKKILTTEYQYSPISFDYGTVYNNIAWAYCLLKRYNEGLPYSLKATQRNPEHGYSWETLGELYFYLGQYQNCINAMTKCISCDDLSQYKSAYRFRGQSYIQIGKSKEGKIDMKKSQSL